MRLNFQSAGTAIVLALLTGSAAAQQSKPDSATERPWAKGVPQANQEKALALFRDGNSALKQSLFVKAAQIYLEALQSWDHPAIHYNLALALVNLDQPLQTHEHLLAALKFGASPLDSDKHEQALRYRALVEKQLAKIEIRCLTPGAAVKLDGVQVFTGPGKYEALVRIGVHTVVASKEGFLTFEHSQTLAGATSKLFEFKLVTAAELTDYRRPWPQVLPWLVVGAGAVFAGSAAGLHLSARDAFKSYDSGIAACVKADTGGCVPSVSLAGIKSRGDTMQGIGLAMYGIGGAALITGAVLVYLNRLQPYRATLEITPTVTLVPRLGPAPGAALFVAF